MRVPTRLARLLLKHPREEPEHDNQASGVNNDCDVDAVPMRILAFFIARRRFIHRSFLFRKVRPKAQYPAPIQQISTTVSTSFCLSEKTSSLRTESAPAAAIRARTINQNER